MQGDLAINEPFGDDGAGAPRHDLDYHTYLDLDRLLAAQHPGTEIPDERIFIITHQLFELVFKQMLFDLSVLSKTLDRLADSPDERSLLRLCSGDLEFWRPALTAAGRIKYSVRDVLPTVIQYLGSREAVHFDGVEFARFRPVLTPASGFQSAQYRLIQKAFGKRYMLQIRLFPNDIYARSYEGEGGKPAKVDDSSILRGRSRLATGELGECFESAAMVEDAANSVLAKLPKVDKSEAHTSPIKTLRVEDFDPAVSRFRKILENHRQQQRTLNSLPGDAKRKDREAMDVFRKDVKKAVNLENERRTGLEAARAGAFYLHFNAPSSYLSQVLNLLVTADQALHGEHEESFLSVHYNIARQRIGDVKRHAQTTGQVEPPGGTGGGGIEYLDYVRKHLVPLFPAIIAYRDLEDSPIWSWIE